MSVRRVLLGARTLEQVLPAASLGLDREDLDAVRSVSAPGLPDYPYGVVEDFSGMRVWKALRTDG